MAKEKLYNKNQIPEHILDLFEEVGVSSGVGRNAHPT